ncbi:Mus7/MMS22 family-domain-containing protein [Immersiella caudata]|uniref:Mus7/MMS22 family-domain-containing protein n=1 Tax=Immersiella caudata TaxID=314043 RepID=A0AA40C683_9PEZI|nr:Mus7/MMS22 family-domain-containing protein [Immersiella caudata]
MRNWRELGEVPASDDENFDDESLDELPQDATVPTGVGYATPAADKPQESLDNVDIWDVPDSSPARPSTARPSTRTQHPPKLDERARRPSTPTRIHVTSVPSTAALEDVSEKLNSSDPPATGGSSFPEDDISTSYVKITAPLAPSSPLSSPPSLRGISPPLSFRERSLPRSRSRSPIASVSPGPARAGLAAPKRPSLPVDDDIEQSRQVAIQVERSLRPRKPIQQHPYLLESAQYTTFMKSHGFKPLRVHLEAEASRKRAQEEDSQEQDFEGDDSLTGSQDGLLQNSEESTQPMLNDGNELDELAPSPSPMTSPPGVGLRASSQPTDNVHTPLTSFSDDEEELPSLERLLQGPANPRVRSLKRQRSQLLSSRRKRPNRLPSSSQGSSPPHRLIPPPDIWDLSSSPEFQAEHQEASQLLGATSPTQSRPRSPLSAPASILPSSTRRHRLSAPTAPIAVEDEESDSDTSTSSSSSVSGSEVIRKNVRRIKGVLPASWLRLDLGKTKPTPRRERSPEPAPVPVPKRGVALPKQTTPGRPAGTQFPFEFDESDEEATKEPARTAKPTRAAPTATPPILIYDDGDDPSDMEQDSIDPMTSVRKRRSRSPSGPRKKAKTAFGDGPGKPRQPRINEVFGRTKSTPSVAHKSSRKGRNKNSTKANARKRATTPPRLSILDVMGPQAPKFVKIAARAVKQRRNLGRTSPSRKLISLATRGDNVDALSSLHDWKSGRTRQRTTISPSLRQEVPASRPALSEVSSNSLPRPPQPRSRPISSVPRKLIRQGSLNAFVMVDNNQPPSKPPSTPSTVKHPRRRAPHDRTPDFRPAQLETEEVPIVRKRLQVHSRNLEAFYKRRNVAPSGSGLSDYANSLCSSTPQPTCGPAAVPVIAEEQARDRAHAKSRFRKKRSPRQVDPEAPQFVRANDPLPFKVASVEEVETPVPQLQYKLKGLGPYGTLYTHHFEIFPLDRGTFFHETTLIGRGVINKTADAALSDKIRRQRPSASFSLDGQTLRWGIWGDNTSSELGILFDWVTDQICAQVFSGEDTGRRAVEAADFVLQYVLDSLSVEDDDAESAFLSRMIEVLSSFASRVSSLSWSNSTSQQKEIQIEVSARFAAATLAVHSICKASSINIALCMKVEGILKRIASTTTMGLLSCGTEDLRTLYGDLQSRSFLERGIRPDRWLANCWVVVMRVLEIANIPRASFWDVAHATMWPPSVASSTDAQVFEGLWLDMFTLLPLGEIDNDGVLIHGLRRVAPLEGWSLPQRLLKRVFQLYQSKCRQSPSFNEYFRALIGRCHYLVQEWGWYKCTGIIGTIFDFFGSEKFANLRNEEAYKSPRFIEELSSNALLSVELEDRSFHIFIKILAMTIRRSRQLGRDNDIRNLVARTLPNNDRQYLKEDTVHQRDLAALRNHHDLLCTLFWASPPDLRPGLHLIEKLVAPGSAHKEACLINLRAWNQLARFITSTDESGVAFRPFVVWNSNVFNQVLDQYLSAASDIEQQFRELSSEHQVSTAVRDEMIAKNKATAMDVLHSLLRASLDVLKHASSFAAATAALNINQLQKVFTTLDFRSAEFDWGVLHVALDAVENFLNRLDEVTVDEFSSGSISIDPQLVDDAVLLLNERLAKDLFWMARTVMTVPSSKAPNKQRQQVACVEKTVTLTGRIAARFIKDRLTQLSSYFSPGKYCLFADLPKNLATVERKFIPLFITVLIKNHVFDFKDLGGVLGLWLLFITKPLQFSGFENYLGEELLKRHSSFGFMERATVGVSPDYNSNVDMFSCAMHYMRKKLREAESESGASRQQLRTDYDKSLQNVMHRMKEDLALMRPDPPGHAAYIDFVRQIISLIKSHGVNICKIDPFFTQPGPDYSPPVQDPQLHMAGIVAYGVRLGEQDVRAVPQFFHYLWNNFKIALGNSRLEQERTILTTAMASEPHVLSFVLQYMIPTAILACERVSEAWLLLEVYSGSLEDILAGKYVPRELMGDDTQHATSIVVGVLAWFESLRNTQGGAVTPRHVYIMRLLAAAVDAVQPSLRTHLYSEQGDGAIAVEKAVDDLRAFLEEARSHVEEKMNLPEGEERAESKIQVNALMAGLPVTDRGLAGGRDIRVQEFATVVVTDVKRTWTISEDRVMVQMAAGRTGTPSSTQAGQGTRYGPWDGRTLLKEWWALSGRWHLGRPSDVGNRLRARGARRRRGIVADEMIL